MTLHRQRRRASRVAAEALIVAAAMALLTWGAHRLHIRAEPAAVLYLCLVVLVSLRGNVVAALLVAVGGIVVWDYVFTAPQVALPQRQLRDVVTLVAFGATAVVITRLVRALRTSEGRWRNVFENNPTLYFMVDGSGTIRAVNPAGAEQLGYTAAELVGQPVLNVFFEADRTAGRDRIANCLARLGESMSWELRKVRKDGTVLWVRETARAVQLGMDPPVVLIACEDITAQKEAQENLRRSEARLRGQASLIDLSHDAILVCDLNSVITYWNRGAEELYGWSREDARGRVAHELLRTEFPEPLADITATLLRTGRWDGECVNTTRDGTRVVVASRWSLQRDEVGKPLRILKTNSDVTERKRAEEGLRRAQAELARAGVVTTMGQLAGSIAHELRQPLAAIAANGSATLRWLGREHPDLAEARDAASRIVRDAQRADEVIRGLRALLGNAGPRRASLDLNDAVREVLELARGELRRNEVSVQTALDPNLPPVNGDRVQLQQVLLNLVVNATEAMAAVTDRPRVLVIRTAHIDTREVVVAVEDTGAGLDPAAVTRIFEPFFTTKPNGLGMGLSICRSIVEAHGGELSASSRAPHGTTFRVTLPTPTTGELRVAAPAARSFGGKEGDPQR